MCWQRCTPHAWSSRVAPLSHVSPSSPTHFHCYSLLQSVTVAPAVSYSDSRHFQECVSRQPFLHGPRCRWQGPAPPQAGEGRGPTGSGAAWGGLTRPSSCHARSWQTHCQPIWCHPNLINCGLPSGCWRMMYSARTCTWVRDGDSLGLLHTLLDRVTRASGSDTAL